MVWMCAARVPSARVNFGSPMDQDAVIDYVEKTFAGVDILRPTDGPGAGDTFFIYDPDHNLTDQQRFPFATIVVKDYGEWDNRSQLDRPGVWRLNVGVSRETFRSLFPSDAIEYDYTALNALIPHPQYAAQSWVSVLNPSQETFDTRLEPLLGEAYDRAVRRIERG